MKSLKLERGMLVSNDSWFYVVVDVVWNEELKSVFLNCICDNANNTYCFRPEDLDVFLTHDQISALRFGINKDLSERTKDLISDRGLPYRIMYEVLSGMEDRRFGDD